MSEGKKENNNPETLAEKTKEELIKMILEMKKKEKEEEEEISKLTKEQIEFLKRKNEMLKETADIVGDTIESAKQGRQIAEKEIELLMNKKEYSSQQREAMKEAMEQIKKFGQVEDKAFANLNEEEQKLLDSYKERVDLEEGLNSIKGDGIVLADKMAASLGMQKKYKDSILGTTVSLLKKLGEEGLEGERAREAMKAYLKDLISAKNIALNVFNAIKDNSIELFTNFDKAQASLAAATGQGDAFRSTLYETGRQGNLFGISMDEAGKAIGTMVDQTSNFTSLSKATQTSLALNVAKMEKLGVATADSAAIFQNFNQGLGMTADESMKMQTELAMAGVAIGVNASKMTKDFNSSLSTLMVYGRESVDVFKGIAAAAKAAGVETSTLLGIASKFDTFAGAAEGAGKLNALLGTQLSTTEMLMATEDERIRMLVESVQSQGVAFQDMDRFTQKAIANAAGITDMAEANRIFGMSLDAYDENERKLNASADAQKKLDDAVAKTVPVMQQFKLLGAELVVALEPLLETLEAGAKWLTEWYRGKSTEEKERIAFWVSLGAAIVLLGPVLKAVIGSFSILGGPLLGIVSAGIKALGTSSSTSAPQVGALTGTMGGLAGSLGAVALELIGIGLTIAAVIASVGLVGYAIAAILEPIKNVLVSAIQGLVSIWTGFVELVLKGASMISDAFSAMFGTDEAEVKLKEYETRTVEAMAQIATSLGSDDSIVARTKAMVDEINKMGQDVKVSSTIENLALITAGKATSITGEKVAASVTKVTANVKNSFENMKMTLKIGDKEFDAYVASIANGETTV